METTSLFWGKYPYRIKVVVKHAGGMPFLKSAHKLNTYRKAIDGISKEVKIIDCYHGFVSFFLTEEEYNTAIQRVPDDFIIEKCAPKNDLVLKTLLANPLSVIRNSLWDKKFRYKMTFQQRDWKNNSQELRTWLLANGLVEEEDFRILSTPYVLLREEEDMTCFFLMFGTSVIKQQKIILHDELENGNA